MKRAVVLLLCKCWVHIAAREVVDVISPECLKHYYILSILRCSIVLCLKETKIVALISILISIAYMHDVLIN